MPAVKQQAMRKRKRQEDTKVPLLPPEVDEDEIDVSDEDIEFVQQNQQFARFLSKVDTEGITKQVLGLKQDWKGDNLEKFYEKKAAAKPSERDVVTVEPADVLPVKNFDGKLEYKGAERQVRKQPQAAETPQAAEPPPVPKEKKGKKDKNARKQERKKLKVDAESENKEEETAPKLDTNKDFKELQTFVSVEERRVQMRTEIAELATKLLSGPDECLASLKELLNTCSDEDESVAQLAMLSLVAVFKDLIPGYRIRPPTEKELQMSVSKEVKKLRDYESALLKNYQAYVQKLAKSTRSSSFQRVAIKCICNLLEAVPHFNYRESLLATIIPFTNSTDEQSRNLSSSAISSIFKHEGKHGGDATVEAVQLVADFVKENSCMLHPDVLRAFLSLSFDEDLFKERGKRDEKHAAPQKYKSKREEKKAKKSAAAASVRKEVEEDFREASTAPDFEERKKLQTITLSALFETYFRVLKTALATSAGESSHPLLIISLEGLLKYSHLISIDFMGDLLAVLRKLAECRANGEMEEPFTVEERLQCCTAAFKIMKMNMDALTVDLRDFYVQFYIILLEISPDKDSDSENSFANALQVVLCDSRQHDMQRMAAFIKRLAALSIHLGTGSAMAALSTMRHLLSRYKQCRNLLENEEGGGGAAMFDADGADPDLSGALSSVLWELTLLGRHYNPEVAKLAKQVASILSNEGLVHCSLTPSQAVAAFSSHSGGFKPAVKLPPSTVPRKQSYKAQQQQRQLQLQHEKADDAADFRSYFKLLRDIRENEALRKEVTRSETMLSMYERYKTTQPTQPKKQRKTTVK